MNSATKKTILIVEDDDGLRLTLREYLEGQGFHILVAGDGVGAIKHILDTKIDLIISDYRMDVLGGDYWMRFLQRFCSDIKVIVTSGFLKGHKNLPFELLEKPFDYALLAARIQSIFSVEDG